MSNSFLPRTLLIFWALYFTLVFASNLSDGLRAAGLLGAGITFVSGNYELLSKVVARYEAPLWIPVLLFLGVIVWEGLVAGFFWRAFLVFPGPQRHQAVNASFTLAILLWMVFILMDELFVVYLVADLTQTHLLLLATQVLTLLLVEGRDRMEKQEMKIS